MKKNTVQSIQVSAEALMEMQALPQLPSIIRYLDDFADEWRVIRNTDADKWEIHADGIEASFDFCEFPQRYRLLVKHWAAWTMTRLAVATARIYMHSLKPLFYKEKSDPLYELLSRNPMELRDYWLGTLLTGYTHFTLRAVKSLLAFLCEMSLGRLAPGYADFVGAFRLPQQDKYAAVRTGDVFLGANEEAAIVDFLDEINTLVRTSPLQVDEQALRSSCILCISYQYAMRPLQIAKIRLSDVRVYLGSGVDGPTIHITFLRAKQRSNGKRLPMLRKIKREWAFIFAELYQRRLATPHGQVETLALLDSLFGLTPQSVSNLLIKTTEAITDIPRPANHLRHSAAQRLVDAGASQVELAEFMGHSYADTGLVYFDASPAQADRVNKALALSPIYTNVADVARTRTIDKNKLLHLSPDHQIGAVPHGIPIAGIGACNLGQSLCSKNPVLSCYSCRRFMAVTDTAIHREVLDSLRPVVRFFYDESRGEIASPAYMQLRKTLESIQAVIADLDESNPHE
ncbi:site-specific integrase (plasmid) [Pseudomonas aeruginosa]|uniref:site-specific integrase n=1 Tax=Pseudomonas TaxID=286 RepID=UPI00376FD4D7